MYLLELTNEVVFIFLYRKVDFWSIFTVTRGGSDWSGWSKVQGRTKTWTKKWTGGPFFSVLFLVMLGPFLSEFGPFLCRFGPFFINCTTKWTGILVFCSKFYRQDQDLTFK